MVTPASIGRPPSSVKPASKEGTPATASPRISVSGVATMVATATTLAVAWLKRLQAERAGSSRARGTIFEGVFMAAAA